MVVRWCGGAVVRWSYGGAVVVWWISAVEAGLTASFVATVKTVTGKKPGGEAAPLASPGTPAPPPWAPLGSIGASAVVAVATKLRHTSIAMAAMALMSIVYMAHTHRSRRLDMAMPLHLELHAYLASRTRQEEGRLGAGQPPPRRRVPMPQGWHPDLIPLLWLWSVA